MKERAEALILPSPPTRTVSGRRPIENVPLDGYGGRKVSIFF